MGSALAIITGALIGAAIGNAILWLVVIPVLERIWPWN
jgi:hypothetical protein